MGNNNLRIAILVMVVCLSPIALAEWCYQESANVSTACGGLNTGNYTFLTGWTNPNNAVDGNWITYATRNSGTDGLFVNYTIPAGSLSTSLWQVKDGNAIINISLPLDCWSSPLRFAVTSWSTNHVSSWSCWNYTSSTWKVLRAPTGGTSEYIYEEAMWWNITIDEPPSVQANVTTLTFRHLSVKYDITKPDTLTFKHKGLNYTAANPDKLLFKYLMKNILVITR